MTVTVFTPTYNRANLLKVLFKSLCEQTCTDFEWIVVDDGSSDETDSVVNDFIALDKSFEIRYYKQQHGGKHRAINLAIKNAKGKYFFIVDSDDYLSNDAIEFIVNSSKKIDDKEDYAGLSGVRISTTGEIVGEYPDNVGDYIDATNLERYKLHLNGDKAEVYKTEVLKNFLFPEIEGENFITERVVWDLIASKGYKLRWYKKGIYYCEYLNDGLTKSGANMFKGHMDNYLGYCLYVEQSLNLWDSIEAITLFREYIRTNIFMKNTVFEMAKNINMPLWKFVLWIIKMIFWYSVRVLKRYFCNN